MEKKKTLKPLYMWAGGKTKLLNQYEEYLPNPNSYSNYVEPFFGGGALYGYLSENNKPSIINDINSELINIYQKIKDNLEDFINELRVLECEYFSKNGFDFRVLFYYEMREKYWSLKEDTIESNALLYFLMKTCFNGIWQTCKKSGGRFGSARGLLKHKEKLFDYDLIRNWNSSLSNTIISSSDYKDLIIPDNSFIFCDPPYRDCFTDYGDSFGDKEQLELIEWCKDRKEEGHKVWLCNKDLNDKFFEDNVGNAKIHKFDITYTAGKRKKTEEGYKALKAVDLLIIF